MGLFPRQFRTTSALAEERRGFVFFFYFSPCLLSCSSVQLSDSLWMCVMYALIPILIVAIAAVSIIIIIVVIIIVIIVVFSALAPVRHSRKVAPPRRAERRFQLLLPNARAGAFVSGSRARRKRRAVLESGRLCRARLKGDDVVQVLAQLRLEGLVPLVAATELVVDAPESGLQSSMVRGLPCVSPLPTHLLILAAAFCRVRSHVLKHRMP